MKKKMGFSPKSGGTVVRGPMPKPGNGSKRSSGNSARTTCDPRMH